MKTIFGNKRTLTSISAIVLALVLMSGGTFAWLTVGVLEDQRTDFGVLDVISTNLDPDDPQAFITRYNLQPGFKWSEDGSIENVGTLDAVVEITAGKIFLTRTPNGKGILDTPIAADSSLYKLGYTPTGVIGATKYVEDWVDIAAVKPGDRVVQHLVVVPGTYVTSTGGSIKVERNRHFLFFDAAGDRYTYEVDANGDYVLDASGKLIVKYDSVTGEPVWNNVPSVGITVKAELDLATSAGAMGNDWNAAYLDGFNLQATQSRYPLAYEAVFGFTQDMLVKAVWPYEVGGEYPYVPLNKRGIYVSPYEFLLTHFDIVTD